MQYIGYPKIAFVFYTFFFLLVHSCFAQKDSLTNNITTTKKLRVGFYKDLAEFKANQPSVILNKKAKITRQAADLNGGRGWYEIELLDTSLNYKSFYKKIWGYSDGKNVFVCDGRLFENNDRTFSRIALLGKLSLVECHDPKAIMEHTYVLKEVAGSMVASGAEILPYEMASKYVYMINTTDDQIKPFNAYTLGETLYLYDKTLYQEFMAKTENERNRETIDFVNKFNSKVTKH